MKAKFKPGWDSAFFLEQAHEEWKQAPRLESEPLEVSVNKQFGIWDLERVWSAIGVRFDVVRFMDHLEMLERWRRRLIRVKDSSGRRLKK